MVVTPEMRAEVYRADCEAQGHQYTVRTALQPVLRKTPEYPDGAPVTELCGPNGQHPYLSCGRCGAAWLLIATGGLDYDDALAKLAALGITLPETPPLSAPPLSLGTGHGHGH